MFESTPQHNGLLITQVILLSAVFKFLNIHTYTGLAVGVIITNSLGLNYM